VSRAPVIAHMLEMVLVVLVSVQDGGAVFQLVMTVHAVFIPKIINNK